MEIPEIYQCQEFWKWLALQAERMLRPYQLDEDLTARSYDIVQKTLFRVSRSPERPDPVQIWPIFMRNALGYTIRDFLKETRRAPTLVSLDASIGHDPADSNDIPLRDTIANSAGDPASEFEESEILERQEILKQKILNYVSAEMDRWFQTAHIRGDLRIGGFVEIVRRFLNDPDTAFDTHRQNAEIEGWIVPPKATAGAWWLEIREEVPHHILQDWRTYFQENRNESI